MRPFVAQLLTLTLTKFLQSLLLVFACLFGMMVSPIAGSAALTAEDLVTLAQQQLTVPMEFVFGEMKVYREERLDRSYAFVLGRLWDERNKTESVRIDFKTAINSGPDSSLHPDQRYLLKREAHAPPTQWLYLPALRRVRITPYRPDDPLLQSDYLFYDLTTILDFIDYRYHYVDANEQTPIVEGEPQAAFVPYQRTRFTLERRGQTYLVTKIVSMLRGKERQTDFSTFDEVAPGRFRPRHMTVVREGGRTEIAFQRWVVSALPEPQLFTPTHLETRTLSLSEKE